MIFFFFRWWVTIFVLKAEYREKIRSAACKQTTTTIISLKENFTSITFIFFRYPRNIPHFHVKSFSFDSGLIGEKEYRVPFDKAFSLHNYIQELNSLAKGTHFREFQNVLKFREETAYIPFGQLRALKHFLIYTVSAPQSRNTVNPQPSWVSPPINRHERHVQEFGTKVCEVIDEAVEKNCGLAIIPSWYLPLTRTDCWRFYCRNCGRTKRVNLDCDPLFACLDKKIYNKSQCYQDMTSLETNGQNMLNFF